MVQCPIFFTSSQLSNWNYQKSRTFLSYYGHITVQFMTCMESFYVMSVYEFNAIISKYGTLYDSTVCIHRIYDLYEFSVFL